MYVYLTWNEDNMKWRQRSVRVTILPAHSKKPNCFYYMRPEPKPTVYSASKCWQTKLIHQLCEAHRLISATKKHTKANLFLLQWPLLSCESIESLCGLFEDRPVHWATITAFHFWNGHSNVVLMWLNVVELFSFWCGGKNLPKNKYSFNLKRGH